MGVGSGAYLDLSRLCGALMSEKELTARQEAAQPVDLTDAVTGFGNTLERIPVDKALDLTVKTAVRDARSSHQAIKVLQKFRFRDLPDGRGGVIKKTPWRCNSSSYEQVLLMLREELEAMDSAALGEQETELDRHAKRVSTLSVMADYTLKIQQAVNRTIDRAAKLEIEGRKLAFLKEKHADEQKRGGFDAKDVEMIADG